MRNESVGPVTAGERLYLLIRDEILDLTGSQSIRWANIGTLVDDVSGGPGLAEYGSRIAPYLQIVEPQLFRRTEDPNATSVVCHLIAWRSPGRRTL
jgi:hypothetical protein